MSFLRRDKSRSNLRTSFGFTAAQSNSSPVSGTVSGSETSEPDAAVHSHTASGAVSPGTKHPGLVKRGSSPTISPSVSTQTHPNSNHPQSSDQHNFSANTGNSNSSNNQTNSAANANTNNNQTNSPANANTNNNQTNSTANANTNSATGNPSNTNSEEYVYYDDNENYSPRSSVISLPANVSEDHSEPEPQAHSNLKDNYRGFHANHNREANTPPLTHPIKPRFKKKSSSLLGKLIYSSRKDPKDKDHSEHLLIPSSNDPYYNPTPIRSRQNSITNNRQSSVGSTTSSGRKSGTSSSSSSKHKFRIPSISLDPYIPHHHSYSGSSTGASGLSGNTSTNNTTNHPTNTTNNTTNSTTNNTTESTTNNSSSNIQSETDTDTDLRPILETAGSNFDLNLDEMKGIIKSPPQTAIEPSHDSLDFTVGKKRKPATINEHEDLGVGGWTAPDSWDVKIEQPVPKEFTLDSEDSEEKVENETQNDYEVDSSSDSDTSLHEKIKPKRYTSESSRSKLPVLYFGHPHPAPDAKHRGPNHTIRVFKEDNTFTTILCPLETTTAELLTIVQRKFFFESTSNYQISVYIGNSVKVLESFEKPLKIQRGLLLLSGYTEDDNFRIIGREDMSFVCKFVVENIYLRNLTHEEEAMLSKDYVDVNISGLNLKNIPIVFHQHTYEIEKLNVGDNPSIYIPLDFIQSCNNLTSIGFSRNGVSKFPMNFLEAKKLTHLDMEKNFLDELPSKISHLKNLTHLKLNSNQLSHLPKSFGKLKNLVSLNLSSNYFKHYPAPLSELINLQELDLSYNDLSYLPESIGNLTKLAKLNLCTNKLDKALPPYFTKLTSLKRLDIRYNQISNVDVLGSLPDLEVAYASKNKINTFSDKMDSLRLLHIDRNPTTDLQFENLLQFLTILDLSKAKITSVPSEFISKIPSVEKLVLDKNHLVNLPTELGDLPKLSFLSLYGNNLQTLPPSFGQLSTLQYLDLHSNNLQSLPNEIWNLKSLTYLNVSSNNLSSFPKPPYSVVKRISSSLNFRTFIASPINDSGNNTPNESRRPSTQSPMPGEEEDKMTYLDNALVSSKLESEPQNSLHKVNASSSLADSLLILTLADNRLSDDCFESISFLIFLKSLNLSYNEFLEIPEGGLRRLTTLTELYFSGNELTTLPADDLESLKNLELLFLNNNKLVSLPAELSKLEELQHIDVGSNQLKYNISNWPYDWNWHCNKNLKYINFSGNKRFEIKQSHLKNPETGEDFDSFLVLKRLKVLGLIDVTLTSSSSIPDQNSEMRIRTTSSELDNIGYGVSDSMGMREHVSSRDVFIQKFRGNENEVLVCSFDGKRGAPNQAHKISALAKQIFVPNFTNELNKIKSDDEIQDAIRRAFLSLNKEINGILAAKKNSSYVAHSPPSKHDITDLSLQDDAGAGCAATILYIKDKKLYTANIGDTEALLSRNNGDHVLLTNKHDPTNRLEFERIRASGGYVSGDGALDGDLIISRGAGFFNYLPHTHSGPDITKISLGSNDDMIVMATKVLWDYVSYELAADLLRQEKDDPMLAAQKLRDYAICYGATDKIAVVVITLGEQKLSRSKFGSNALYHNLGRESELYAGKKRRGDRTLVAGDSQLRRLEDEIEPPVGEIALVFTDIKTSTLLWDSYPVPMRSAIKIHNNIMRRQLRIVGGYEVKTEGDAFMVSFPSPTSALLWCFNVQQNLLTADWPAEILDTDQCCEVADSQGNVIFRGLSVRMGIHWGAPVCEPDVVTGRMDYFGPMVNRTSRISAIADGGQITVSSDFLDEMKALYQIHENIQANNYTLEDAYEGNVRAGEIIEKEINSINAIGCEYYSLGEKKLKGLETPELVTLAFPSKLKVRYELLQMRLSQDTESMSTRIIGAIPVDAICKLRTVSLRLENICAIVSGGSSVNEMLLQQQSSSMIESSSSLKELELIGLFNHIVTRIENCAATLLMRQELSKISGHGGMIEIGGKSTATVMNEFSDIMNQFRQIASQLPQTLTTTSK